MAVLIKVGTVFIAPAPTSKVDDAVYAALDLEVATIVDHTPARDEDIPAIERKTSTSSSTRLAAATTTPPRRSPHASA